MKRQVVYLHRVTTGSASLKPFVDEPWMSNYIKVFPIVCRLESESIVCCLTIFVFILRWDHTVGLEHVR